MELSRRTFRRFVQLYLLLFLLSIPAVVWEVVEPASQAFDAEFEALLVRFFGWTRYSNTVLWVVMGLLLAHLAGGVALLWFKRWARLLFWSSLVAALALLTLFGPVVSYYYRWTVGSEFLAFGLFGVIVLMSYASGLGSTWFAKGAEAQQG